jgi:hypothetical protein
LQRVKAGARFTQSDAGSIIYSLILKFGHGCAAGLYERRNRTLETAVRVDDVTVHVNCGKFAVLSSR